MVSERMLIKFKQIYYAKYNIELTDKEATEQATMFLQLMTVLLKPSPNKKQQTAVSNTPETHDEQQLSLL